MIWVFGFLPLIGKKSPKFQFRDLSTPLQPYCNKLQQCDSGIHNVNSTIINTPPRRWDSTSQCLIWFRIHSFLGSLGW